MQTITDFAPADRYVYDFGACSIKNGFAQVDTSQDAHYFGTWANPKRLMIVCYCEGDVTIQTADNAEEFTAAIRKMKAWNEEMGHKFHGIDPGWPGREKTVELEQGFKDVGLGDLLH